MARSRHAPQNFSYIFVWPVYGSCPNERDCAAIPRFGLGQAQHRSGNKQITRNLRESDKAPQRLAHNPSHHGQRIADDRHPAQQERPSSITAIPVRCPVERRRTQRNQTVPQAFNPSTKTPVCRRTQDVAHAGDKNQRCGREGTGNEEYRKRGLRLCRKDGRRGEGNSKQTAVYGKDFHLLVASRSRRQGCTSITTISPPPPFSSTLLLVV